MSADFSQQAVKKAVLEASLQHPLVLYPAAFGLLGGLGAMLITASPLLIAASAAGGSVAAATLAVNFLFRRDALARRYLDRACRRIIEQREAVLRELQEKLKRAGTEEGLRQLKRFQDKIVAFEDVLSGKFKKTEITYGRFLGIAEQVYLAGIDNLNSIVLALKGAGAVDQRYIQQRLRKLEEDPATSPVEVQEVAGLNQQLQLRQRHLDKVDSLLAINEQALAELDASMAALAEIRTQEGSAAEDMETAMRALQEVAARAHEYSTN